MLKAKLVVVGGDAKAAEISLKLPTTIGRGREASLTLPHPLVSRNHCELFEKGGLLRVRDLKSLNGTYVDNQRIEASAVLKPDQLLTIGNVTFRAIYDAVNANSEAATPEIQDDAAEQAKSSNVIEFNEVASADCDSKLDPNLERKSIQSSLNTPIQENDAPIDVEKTLKANTPKPRPTVKPASSDVMDEAPSAAPQPQHSIVAAMVNTVGDSPASLERASLADVRGQLGDMANNAAAASGVDGLVVDPSQAPAVQADFSSIDLNEKMSDKVSTDDDVLGSFIRKMPR